MQTANEPHNRNDDGSGAAKAVDYETVVSWYPNGKSWHLVGKTVIRLPQKKVYCHAKLKKILDRGWYIYLQ